MSKVINRLVAVLEAFVSHPDVDLWSAGHYHFSATQDSDGYYGYLSYRDNNVVRIAMPPAGTQGNVVVLVRHLGDQRQTTSRTIGAALKAVYKNLKSVSIKKGKLTLSDGRLVPAVDWLEV